MKRTYTVQINGKQAEREYSYIPFRYIIAVLITALEVLAVLGIVVALCRYVSYFYILAWLTEIGCVIKIIASDDNPDYRSLVHHFENGVWIYGCRSIKALKTDLEDTLGKYTEITLNMLKRNLLQRFLCAVVRIFAPML